MGYLFTDPAEPARRAARNDRPRRIQKGDRSMEHYIIVKFTEGTDVKALVEPVRAIFEETLEIPGIQALNIRTSNSDIENRYDLMIRIDMDKEALPAYAASEPHLRWKKEYGSRIAKKAIFDCD